VTKSGPTIPGVLAQRVREDADLQAIVSDDRSITYAELDDDSRSLASRLVAAGIGKGDRVGLLMANGVDWAVTSMAILRIGAVLVPLSTLLRPPELLAQLRTASVTDLVATRNFRGRSYLEELESIAAGVSGLGRDSLRLPALPSLRHMWLDDELPTATTPAGVIAQMEERVRPADDLAIMFTSGSRGAPKGVIHTHGGALRATAAGLDARCIGRRERLYIPMPFFWVGGFGGGLLSVLVAGATLLTEVVPEPVRTLRFLEDQGVTLFRGWPDQAARIAAHPAFATADLSSLRPGSLDGVLPSELRAKQPGARANLFGMTETFGPYCGSRLDLDLPPSKYGSCGRPFDGVEVRIVDPSTGAAVAAGSTGEIAVRGPNVMRGIRGRLRSEVFDADGFYPTGDLGALDEDGYLWYSGRLDDMVKIKGATVYPSEVEGALRAVSGVRQAFVTDVDGDEGRSQIGALVVANEGVVLTAIVDALRNRLSSFKVPARWVVTSDPGAVPLMATGKVDKAGLQRLIGSKGVPVQRIAREKGAGWQSP
jgi:acyl-CoA synthetase (AMP-forming)/AMP-acid ligase II